MRIRGYFSKPKGVHEQNVWETMLCTDIILVSLTLYLNRQFTLTSDILRPLFSLTEIFVKPKYEYMLHLSSYLLLHLRLLLSGLLVDCSSLSFLTTQQNFPISKARYLKYETKILNTQTCTFLQTKDIAITIRQFGGDAGDTFICPK
jgi:hypothetical protein